MKSPPVPVPHVSAKIKNCGVTPISDDHDDLWNVPTLAELGYEVAQSNVAFMLDRQETEQLYEPDTEDLW